MKRGQLPHGYTILETMVVFLVTAVMLTTALLMFNGQQDKTRFTSGLREMESSINTVINETISGYYPAAAETNCQFVFSTFPGVFDSGGQGRGTNENCVMLGKSLQFYNTEYRVHTIAGRRLEGDGKTQVRTLEDPDGFRRFTGAQPSLINGFVSPLADLSILNSYPPSLQVYDMYQVRNGTSSNIGSVAFVYTLAPSQESSFQQISGAASISLIGVDNTTLNDNATTVATRTQQMEDADRNTDFVVICFRQGLSNVGARKGAIVIGGQGRELTTEVIVDAVNGTEPGRQCS